MDEVRVGYIASIGQQNSLNFIRITPVMTKYQEPLANMGKISRRQDDTA